MSAAVLTLADIDSRAWTYGTERSTSARKRRLGAGWSALPMTLVHDSSVLSIPEEVPVYSIATEPRLPRGEYRWAGQLVCLMTALGTGSAMLSLFL